LLILNKPESGKIAYNSKNFEGEKIEDHILKSRDWKFSVLNVLTADTTKFC